MITWPLLLLVHSWHGYIQKHSYTYTNSLNFGQSELVPLLVQVWPVIPRVRDSESYLPAWVTMSCKSTVAALVVQGLLMAWNHSMYCATVFIISVIITTFTGIINICRTSQNNNNNIIIMGNKKVNRIMSNNKTQLGLIIIIITFWLLLAM